MLVTIYIIVTQESTGMDPQVIEHISDLDMKLYLEFTSSPCIRGGGCSIEYALQTLYEADGNVMEAMEILIAKKKNDLDGWSMGEQLMFERAISKHGKRFDLISQDIKTKSVKKCIEFYYLWKHSSSRSPSVNYQLKNKFPIAATNSNTQQVINSGTLARQPLAQTYNITSKQLTNSISNPNASEINNNNNNNNSTLITNNNGNIIADNTALFLCKVCGRAFEKIKSRSAHMKRHKNERYPL